MFFVNSDIISASYKKKNIQKLHLIFFYGYSHDSLVILIAHFAMTESLILEDYGAEVDERLSELTESLKKIDDDFKNLTGRAFHPRRGGRAIRGRGSFTNVGQARYFENAATRDDDEIWSSSQQETSTARRRSFGDENRQKLQGTSSGFRLERKRPFEEKSRDYETLRRVSTNRRISKDKVNSSYARGAIRMTAQMSSRTFSRKGHILFPRDQEYGFRRKNWPKRTERGRLLEGKRSDIGRWENDKFRGRRQEELDLEKRDQGYNDGKRIRRSELNPIKFPKEEDGGLKSCSVQNEAMLTAAVSSIVKKEQSRLKYIKEKQKNKNEAVKAREKRMFSRLLNTLKTFDMEQKNNTKIQEEKQREVDAKLEEQNKVEHEKLRAEKQQLFEKRRQHEAEIRQLKYDKILLSQMNHKITQLKIVQKYIQTTNSPCLLYLPAKHTIRTLELQKKTKRKFDEMIKKEQDQVKEKLKSLRSKTGLHQFSPALHETEEMEVKQIAVEVSDFSPKCDFEDDDRHPVEEPQSENQHSIEFIELSGSDTLENAMKLKTSDIIESDAPEDAAFGMPVADAEAVDGDVDNTDRNVDASSEDSAIEADDMTELPDTFEVKGQCHKEEVLLPSSEAKEHVIGESVEVVGESSGLVGREICLDEEQKVEYIKNEEDDNGKSRVGGVNDHNLKEKVDKHIKKVDQAESIDNRRGLIKRNLAFPLNVNSKTALITLSELWKRCPRIFDVLRAKEPAALIAESGRQRCISISVHLKRCLQSQIDHQSEQEREKQMTEKVMSLIIAYHLIVVVVMQWLVLRCVSRLSGIQIFQERKSFNGAEKEVCLQMEKVYIHSPPAYPAVQANVIQARTIAQAMRASPPYINLAAPKSTSNAVPVQAVQHKPTAT
ncbi:hypothetical protein T07_8701 [Trichinella nelsoni]|uniref:Pinin/SDK/MemA protein domain-containing protein n=1 Tax=Trichinella nelsoni TaxID=6336 RepID=A0A0V0S4E7_9BILA|nr:hypothetical protein T07_8701 [Trichinella nelsoni]